MTNCRFSAFKTRLIKAWNSAISKLLIIDKTSDIHPLKLSYDELYSTLNAIPDLMFELDIDGRHLDYRVLNPDLLVAPIQELMGHTVAEVMPEAAAKAVMRAINETVEKGYSHGTHIYLPTPQGEKWFEVSIGKKAHNNNEEQRFIVLSRDITSRKTQQLETERLAFLDPLTELPNRYALTEKLKTDIQKDVSHIKYSAILFLDLDNFKSLNDNKGHSQGDLLLKILAKRLTASVRQSDLVVRWGGDEFVILLSNLDSNPQTAEQKAKDICNAIKLKTATPYELNECLYECSISIGVKIFNNLDEDIEQIIQHADDAMYIAKKSSKQTINFHLN